MIDYSFVDGLYRRELIIDRWCDQLLENESEPGDYCLTWWHRDNSCIYFDAEVMLERLFYLCGNRGIKINSIPDINFLDPGYRERQRLSVNVKSEVIPIIMVRLNDLVLFRFGALKSAREHIVFISKPLNILLR